MAGGRPAKPMFAPPGVCDDGALDYADAATFLGVNRTTLDGLVNSRTLTPLYFGRKPVLLKRQLIELLERKFEESMSKRTD